MKKSTKETSFEELVDWAAGCILKELIKGNFREAVWFVLDQTIRWRDAKGMPKLNKVAKKWKEHFHYRAEEREHLLEEIRKHACGTIVRQSKQEKIYVMDGERKKQRAAQ